MDIKGAFMDAIALVRDPKAFMTARADTAPPVMSTIINYVAILAVIPFLFTLLGYLAFPHGHQTVFAVSAGIVAYIFALVNVVVIGYIVFMLAPRFASVANLNKATKLVSYVYTPVFLIAIVNIVPSLTFLNILALLYGLYIVYLGLPIVLKTPQNKVVMYVVATLVAELHSVLHPGPYRRRAVALLGPRGHTSGRGPARTLEFSVSRPSQSSAVTHE